jgi:hypothetical protein
MRLATRRIVQGSTQQADLAPYRTCITPLAAGGQEEECWHRAVRVTLALVGATTVSIEATLRLKMKQHRAVLAAARTIAEMLE